MAERIGKPQISMSVCTDFTALSYLSDDNQTIRSAID